MTLDQVQSFYVNNHLWKTSLCHARVFKIVFLKLNSVHKTLFTLLDVIMSGIPGSANIHTPF